jgi:hypothetical protein
MDYSFTQRIEVRSRELIAGAAFGYGGEPLR